MRKLSQEPKITLGPHPAYLPYQDGAPNGGFMTLIHDRIVAEPVKIVENHGSDRHHLMDILRDIQKKFGCVDKVACGVVAKVLGIHKVEVEGVVSFYHFLTREQKGSTTVWLSKGAVPSISGVIDIASEFEILTGSKFGVSPGNSGIGLEWTSCIGMNDQEPACLIDDVVFTKLTPGKVAKIVAHLKKGGHPRELVTSLGDGNNSSLIIRSMVKNNLRHPGDVIFAEREIGPAIRKAVAMEPGDVIAEVKNSNLRGRGGAGFPTGLKWEFTRKCERTPRYVVCNADEGEPGTFKDRVILTERPELVFEGMVICGYAIGAEEGILYLRGEYEYLRAHLEVVLMRMRDANLLGNNIGGKEGFDFEIKIQVGAGAYICGEETALIESAEGKRGEPRDRPPFPVTDGYMNQPTSVNNVETLASAARVIENGAVWFTSIGTEKSSGTKVLSISGDVDHPGVYEYPFGVTINELLETAGVKNVMAVQVGGPSGKCIGPAMFDRKIAFEDLATGGSIIVIGVGRDLLQIVHDFMEFFIDESCGRCTPCRVGNVLLLNRLKKIMNGRGTKSDIDYMKSLGRVITQMSRCGMGLTSSNPVITTLENFPEVYEKLLNDEEFIPEYDLEKSIQLGREAANPR